MLAALIGPAAGCGVPFVMGPAKVRLPGYQVCSTFSEGLALLKSSSSLRLGYVDTSGTIVIAPRFFAATGFAEGFAAAQEDGRDGFGFVDRRGTMVIEPRFDAALPFSEGLAPVRLGDRWGFVDRTGALAIPARYDNVWGFSEGRARAALAGLTGYIDATGAWVVAPSYFKAGDVREGMAPVCDRSRCGFLDRAGGVAIELRFDDVGAYSGGLAPVRLGNRWGYVDRTGMMVIEPLYEEAAEFADGLARVGIVKDASYDTAFGGYSGRAVFHGFIDARGATVFQPQILGTTSFSEGFAVVRLPSGGLCSDCYHYRLMSRDGTFLPGRFDLASPVVGGLAVVKVGQHSYVIDRRGAPLVQLDASYLHDAIESIRRVVSIRLGFIDPSGKVVVAHRYVTAQPFSEGLAFVEGRWDGKKRERGYIDRSGSLALAIPSGVSQALPFTEGLALVSRSEHGSLRYGFMDRAGAIVVAVGYADAAPFAEGLAAVKLSRELGANDWGYVDRAGAIAIAPRFRAAGSFSGGLAYVEWVTKERFLLGGVIDRHGQVVVDKPYTPELSRALFGTPSMEQYRRRRSFAFGEGLIPWLDGSTRGWVDPGSRLKIPGERFAHLGVFSEGRAPVLVNGSAPGRGGWGFVDRHGVVVVEPRFAQVQPFSEGLAAVRDTAGRWGYVTPLGGLAIPPAWLEEVTPFSDGRALVRLGGLWGYLDTAGRFAIPPRYPRAEPFSEGLAATAIAAPRSTRKAR